MNTKKNRNEVLAEVLKTLADKGYGLEDLADTIATSISISDVPEANTVLETSERPEAMERQEPKTEEARISKNSPTKEQLYERITELLNEFGVPARIDGFQYLRDSIMLYYFGDPNSIKMTTDIYHQIAEKFSTTGSRVERALRHAIEVSFDRGNVELLHSCFGYGTSAIRGKPTNGEFIAAIADKLHIEFKDYQL